MALNFGVLSQVPSFGQSFMAGQQASQAQAERNMLRQAQAEQMQFQRENMMAQRDERLAIAQERKSRDARATQRQQFLTGAAEALAQGGNKLDRPTLMRVLQSGVQADEPSLVQFAREGLKALEEEELYQREAGRLGLPGAAAPAAGAAEPVNALAAPPAAAPGPRFTREQVQEMIVSPNARIREQGKALVTTLEKPEKPQTYTPSADMQGYELAKSQGFKGTFFDYKRQLAEAGRQPTQPRPEPAPRTQQVTMNDGTLGIVNMDTGQVTPASLGGAPVKGKPSAFAEKTAVQRKQLGLDLDRAITELTEATKDKGLIDQSTGSGAGRGVDIAAGFFGKATPGAIAAGKLAPIADMVLKMVPRFEGPQSDKDTRSYKEAAGQLADSSLPNAIRKQAGLEIVRLMKARKNEFITPEMATEGVNAAPATTKSGATVSNW